MPSFVNVPPEIVKDPLTEKIEPGELIIEILLPTPIFPSSEVFEKLFKVPELNINAVGLKNPLLQTVPPFNVMLPVKYPIVSIHNVSPVFKTIAEVSLLLIEVEHVPQF
jgi:hypothetical protein